MKYFLDTEFLEDGRTIELISIGIVREDGKEYYAVNEEAPWSRICEHDWLRENVVPFLPIIITPLIISHKFSTHSREKIHYRHDKQPSPDWRLKDEIKDEVLDFIGDDKPEFWGYYADYDWVVFCQLFGKMIDLPKHFPMYCRDLKQLCDDLGNPKLPKCEKEHNALEDARWNKQVYDFLKLL